MYFWEIYAFLSRMLLHISHNEFQSLSWDLVLILFFSDAIIESFNSSGKYVVLFEGAEGQEQARNIMTQSLTFSSLKKSLFNIENVSIEWDKKKK